MPKIEVNQKHLEQFAGFSFKGKVDMEDWLMNAKGEVDDVLEGGALKLEFNDTNRPDLWSTAGAGRFLRVYSGKAIPGYPFFSSKSKTQDSGNRTVTVDGAIQPTRPYIAAFAVTGKKVDEETLKDLIQTQEKLCWNYGRKRKSIAMGIYRSGLIQYPVQYKAADPDATKFQPLGLDQTLSLREILKAHPKGVEFGPIVAQDAKFPFLTDSRGEVLSFPPVINSAKVGAVEAGDSELFIEMTGTDLPSLTLTASIVACDLADAGFTILPVKVVYPFDTPYGREITFPFYYQEPVSVDIPTVIKMLGEEMTSDEIVASLRKMGVPARFETGRIHITVPEYRNDFLHTMDIVEDIMIGRGLKTFEPVFPQDSTVGRLTAEELYGRTVRDLMIGQGFQEMIYNYLGSAKDYIEKMGIDAKALIQISNPMSENYEFVRNSIAPALLESEAVSGHAPYPHHIFEVGKVAFVDPADVTGSSTRNYLGFLSADREENFNLVNARIGALMYYLNKTYTIKESTDPRFIPGRAADLWVKDAKVGTFGEVHPQVLTNWSITMPCTLAELDLDLLHKS